MLMESARITEAEFLHDPAPHRTAHCPEMINTPFNALPRAVRERLVKLTTEKAESPLLLLSSPAGGGGWVPWFFGIVALIALGVSANFLYGRHRSGLGPRYDQEIYAIVLIALFFFFLCASRIAMRRVWKKPPYRTGKWVLPSGLLELTDGMINFLPSEKLGKPTLVTVKRNGSYQHTRLDLTWNFWFVYDHPKKAEESTIKVLTAKANFVNALAARDEALVRALDPFAECTLSGVWTSTENSVFGTEGPRATPVPWRAVGLQVLISALLAVGITASAYEIAAWSMSAAP
jgi:hypothetical protein